MEIIFSGVGRDGIVVVVVVGFLGEEVHLIDDHAFIIGRRRRVLVMMGAVEVEWELDGGWRRPVEGGGVHGRKLPVVKISVVVIFREGVEYYWKVREEPKWIC